MLSVNEVVRNPFRSIDITRDIRSKFAVLLALNGLKKKEVYDIINYDDKINMLWAKYFKEWNSDRSDSSLTDFIWLYVCALDSIHEFSLFRTHTFNTWIKGLFAKFLTFSFVTITIGAGSIFLWRYLSAF